MGHWSLVTSWLTPALGSCANCPLIMLKVSLSQCQFELSCDKTNHLIFNVYKTSNNPNIRAAYLISVFTLGLNSLFECSGSLCHDLRYWSRTPLSSDSDPAQLGVSLALSHIHYDWRSNRHTSRQIMKILHHCE